MSLSDRDKAVELLISIMVQNPFDSTKKHYYKSLSNHIINSLLKAGYVNDKMLVNISEVQDELDQAIFKCKVEE